MFSQVDISQTAFVAADAVLIGDIKLEVGSSVWYKAVIRADLNAIHIGTFSNIQDGAILHGDVGLPLVIEDYVTVGHNAVIHGLKVGKGSLIGIGAVILEGVTIGVGSIVGAGAVVTKDVPNGVIVAGIPAKLMRSLSEQEQDDLVLHAQKYHKLALYHAGKGTEKGFY